ncbi:MAG TPA: hypothetical protein VHO69_02210 [Phototrophicaceae bacterium]|nr:hypothetical protein [Phototrophicaceae bacterium]
MKYLLCLFSLFILAACGSNNTGGSGGNGLITWDRSPETVVFRADVEGGTPESALWTRNEIPACTVYGDNRVVWTNELGQFNTQVLWDKVTDEQIVNFVTFLTINDQIYSYTAKANLEPPSDTMPVVETLTIFVNGKVHKTDAFGGWDIDYYRKVIDACRQISIAPVLFEPTGAWVSAEAVTYDYNAPLQFWDASASGLDLAALAASGERKWITDRNVPILWNIARTSSPRLQFIQDETQYYYVSIEVPGVNRDAPPAPK